MFEYQVVVSGRVGTVYGGGLALKAAQFYHKYVEKSKRLGGVASGERVVLLHGDEIVSEHIGDKILEMT